MGGRLMSLARKPRTKAREIQVTSPRAIATHSKSMSYYPVLFRVKYTSIIVICV